jgi:hypothetical protein
MPNLLRVKNAESWQRNMPSARSQGAFAYFCRRLDKSKAYGGTRPAGFAFVSQQKQAQQINNLLG